MENHPHHSDSSKPGPPSPGPSRKRSRASSEDEDRAIEGKRIKARERQRRKRERDRSGRDKSGCSSAGVTSFANHDEDPAQQLNVYGPPVEHLANGHPRGHSTDQVGLSPEEAAKKERVRTAARERQRKHRASVKAKRMAELGMAIVNAGGGVEQTAVGYVLNEHGQYEPVMEDPNNPQHHQHHTHEPPFPAPQPQTTPGQTFASTLLLSFSCAPLLKQHLLRTLHMSDEELASFEPIIAAAWDHWDHERAMHYAAAAASSPDHNGPSTSYLPPHPPPHPHPHAHLYPSSDFRARFHRPLVAPFPSTAPPILRPEGSAFPANGSATTNGSYADQRDGGDSDGQEDHDHDHEDGRASSRPRGVTMEESIDPTLEAGGTSDVRGQREEAQAQGQAQEHGRDEDTHSEKHEPEPEPEPEQEHEDRH